MGHVPLTAHRPRSLATHHAPTTHRRPLTAWQSVFDDWWKGRSPQCGRVRFDHFTSLKLVLLQLCFPFLRILHVKSNDLYPWSQNEIKETKTIGCALARTH